MRFAVYTESEQNRLAAVDGDRIAPLGDGWSDLSQVFEAQGLEKARAVAAALPASAWRPLASVRLALPLARPGKVVCIGLNYRAHAAEGGFAVPDYPALFLRVPTSLVAANAPIRLPRVSEKLDYEAELLVVIGKGGRYIPESSALDHVFGYAVGLDMTRRDLQGEAKKLGRPWEVGKAFEASAPCGEIVRASEIGHPAKGAVWLDVNGVRKQTGDLDQLIWKVPEMISYLSGLFELQAGDLIYSGTPAGVNAVQRGDTMVGGVDGVGTITITVS